MGFGNRCGHNPDNPDFKLAKDITRPDSDGKGGQPLVLRRLAERLQQYYDKPWKIPSLNLANGSSRQQRTERRLACIKLLIGLLKFMDLSSLRIGFATKDGFECVTLDLIAGHVGLRKNRLERAHKDLVAAGLITSTSRYERDENGNYKGLAAVRCISKRLFGMFGLAKMLKYEREKAYKKLKNKAKKVGKTITEICRFKPFFNSSEGAGHIGGNKPVQEILGLSAGSINCSDPPMSIDDKKRLQLRVIELYQQGNKNREECYKIARGELDL